ncbi:MAG: hypothetical protein DRJ09_08185, partial [Bacteroidetes bacterium]
SYAGYGNNIYIDNLEISNAVGILSKRKTVNDMFQLFPNPANKMVNIVLLNVGRDGMIKIMDLNGKHLIKQNTVGDLNEIDVSQLHRGVYIIQIQDNNTVKEKKLIIE